MQDISVLKQRKTERDREIPGIPEPVGAMNSNVEEINARPLVAEG
jgi:hypothetical protein